MAVDNRDLPSPEAFTPYGRDEFLNKTIAELLNIQSRLFDQKEVPSSRLLSRVGEIVPIGVKQGIVLLNFDNHTIAAFRHPELLMDDQSPLLFLVNLDQRNPPGHPYTARPGDAIAYGSADSFLPATEDYQSNRHPVLIVRKDITTGIALRTADSNTKVFQLTLK